MLSPPATPSPSCLPWCAIFALLQREDLRNRLVRLIGTDDLHHTVVAIDDAGRRLSRYFLTQLSINAVFSVVIGVEAC